MTAATTPFRVLLLGGTSEARALAEKLAHLDGIAATLSLAGRTLSPHPSPLPTRVGGFGGVEGLAAFLQHNRIDALIDATHPFAAEISGNAVAACRQTGTPLLAFERQPWIAGAGDVWEDRDTIEASIAALPRQPCTVFSGLGRKSVAALGAAPHHHYVIRVVDPFPAPLPLPRATVITARGPFRIDDDIALFKTYGVGCVLAKNAGGDATYAKIAAARHLGLKVYMVRRPKIAVRETSTSVDDVMSWVRAHQASRSKRGV